MQAAMLGGLFLLTCLAATIVWEYWLLYLLWGQDG